MANYERAPRDRDQRAFDGGEDEDNEGSHLPVVIIIAILVLAAFGGVVWLAYNQGVARGRTDAPTRVAAAQQTKADNDNGIKVYQQPAGSDGEDQASRAPQQPAQPQPAQQPEQQPAQPPPVQTQQPAQQPAPAPVQAAPRQPASAPPPAPAPQPAQTATHAPAQLGGTHASPPPAPPAARPAPPAAPADAGAPGGPVLLQIGAFRSTDEAMAAWRTYQAKHATLLAGLGPNVLRVDLGPKGVWYRLRIASFPNRETATALCERIKAQGGDCFLAR